MRHFRYTPPTDANVDVVVDDVHLWGGNTPTSKLRGLCISEEITVSIDYDADGWWQVCAVSFDADEKLAIASRWEHGKGRMTLSEGPLFDLIVAALRERHDDEIMNAIGDDMAERRNDAEATYYDWLDDQRKEHRHIAAE